ncbi:MAG: zinc protease, partial [Bacteroidia bacterium]
MTLDRTKAPEAKSVTHFKLKPAQSFTLDNGIPVCVVSGGSQPIANLQLVFNAGKWHESQEGQSHFTGKMLGEGTKGFSNHEISKIFEQHGVFWAVSAHSDWLEMNFYSLNKQLKNVMPIIQEMLTKATFPEKELEQLKNTAIQNNKVDLEKSSYMASMKFKELLFGKTHPYGYSLNAENIGNTKVDSLLKFYKKVIQENGFQLFLAGEIEESHIEELNQSIGKIDFGSFKAESPQYDIPETKAETHHINWEDALQSALRIGRTIFVKGHEEQIPFNVMNTIL